MLISATLFTVAKPGLANGQDSVSSELVEFDIPEQPLAAALERFMTLSNVTIVADSGVVGTRKSSTVRGAFSVAGALQLLLEGTGLDSQQIGPGAYTLVALPQSTEAARLPRFMNYAA